MMEAVLIFVDVIACLVLLLMGLLVPLYGLLAVVAFWASVEIAQKVKTLESFGGAEGLHFETRRALRAQEKERDKNAILLFGAMLKFSFIFLIAFVWLVVRAYIYFT